MSQVSRVAIAMSGGVDSSVAALLLQQQRHETLGVTMSLVEGADGEDFPARACCSWGAVQRARTTCRQLGIPHYVLDFVRQFEQTVIRDFLDSYAAALTPNPCVRCNEWLKFGALRELMSALGVELIATGHYAICEERAGRWVLRRGADRSKDQSYALYGLTQEQLARAVFPLGELTKGQVREIAREHRLPTAEIPDSQDLCFVPDGDYSRYFEERAPVRPGPILDLDGNELGRHDGLHQFTIGQRSGMGISAPTRLYVVDLDPERNAVIAGPKEALPRHRCRLTAVNWVSQPCPAVGESIEGEAEVRYRSTPTPATLTVTSEDTAEVRLPENESALTPGQSVVLYCGEVVVGGGIIGRQPGD